MITVTDLRRIVSIYQEPLSIKGKVPTISRTSAIKLKKAKFDVPPDSFFFGPITNNKVYSLLCF